MISAHLAAIQTLVERYAATSFVADTRLNIESRPGEQAYLSGVIVFLDGSELYFSEFLDGSETGIEKIMYSYHFQDSAKQLVFRYDNARHKPPLPFSGHKHLPDKIVEHPAPSLEIVLEEIILLLEF
ncbi:MAG TPA: DUF6516 family protein [Anaerolineales bacterium]|nr:DUF6516 family protein [Anaerolineales bacterium]